MIRAAALACAGLCVAVTLAACSGAIQCDPNRPDAARCEQTREALREQEDRAQSAARELAEQQARQLAEEARQVAETEARRQLDQLQTEAQRQLDRAFQEARDRLPFGGPTLPGVPGPQAPVRPVDPPAGPLPATAIVWPFKPAAGEQWVIVNGYRGEVDHHGYASYALDFALCRSDKVDEASRTCELPAGWINATDRTVYAPVTGSVAWDDCRGIAIAMDEKPGYRVFISHLDGHPMSGRVEKGTTEIGTVSASSCADHGDGGHIHLVVYDCGACQSDRGPERTGHELKGPLAIQGCEYPDPDPAHVVRQQYYGRLVPC